MRPPARSSKRARPSFGSPIGVSDGSVAGVATGLAAKAGSDETVQLFRSVDPFEFDALANTGRFGAAVRETDGIKVWP